MNLRRIVQMQRRQNQMCETSVLGHKIGQIEPVATGICKSLDILHIPKRRAVVQSPGQGET